MNLRLFLMLSHLFVGATLSAQLSVYEQRIHSEYFDLVEYDSIGLSLDTAGSFNTLAGVSQEYFFQNNSKVRRYRLFAQGSLLEKGFGEWKGKGCELKTYDLGSQDTVQKEIFYLDAHGRDSVYEIIGNYKQPNENISEIHYRYNAFGRISHKVELEGVPLDTSYREEYFYSSTGTLDSILISGASGQVVLWVHFNSDGTGRVNSVVMVGKLPTNTIDTLSSYEPIYNSDSEVFEIRQYNHAFVQSKELAYVIRFYKRPNSTIGLDDANSPGFGLYPNPVDDECLVQLPFTPSGETTIEIYSISGQLLQSQDFDQPDDLLRVDVDLPGGIYLLKVKTEGYEAAKQMVVE